ncbi:hypothetical protein QUF61_16140, partial [Candidatus Venteria ishoeyi]|uniref:hypothetical protein n=1 Tax=Candidatus Venteria ishoeyi TaxID=1899563 RepID=UPI0025A5DC1E
ALPLAILMRPVGAKQQGLSALYLGFQPPNALTHPSFSGWLFSKNSIPGFKLSIANNIMIHTIF